MINRLAPWQRLYVAIARGVTLAPSGNMKWTAHVKVFGAHPRETQEFVVLLDADSEMDAARSAANISAKRVYGDEGSSGFVNETHAPLYMATIGYYDGRGVTRGRSIEMLLLRYTHPVTGK